MLGVATVLINQSQGFLGQWAAADALERARRLVSDARALEPTSEGVLISAIRLLDAEHRWEDMIPAAERLIQAFPNRVEGYEYLGTAKRYTGRADELRARPWLSHGPFFTVTTAAAVGRREEERCSAP